MSKLTDLAARIDEMTLDEMLAESQAADIGHLPTVGGEYDTVEGWAKRLGVSRGRTQKLVAWLGCERRTARVNRGDSYYTCKVIYSPILAKRAG